MRFPFGCHHPSFAPPWRSLLPYLVALHLLRPGSAQLRVVATSLRVTAVVGQDVVLRCQLSPCKDAWSSDIRWIQHRTSGFVHHYQNGVDLEQMEEYKGRTELLRDGLSDGNLDLLIKTVSSSDSGSYSCTVQDDDGYADAVVELEVSDPFSQIIHPWMVALAVVVTLLVGSFVTIVFLYRKRVAQSRELKRKDAELEKPAGILNSTVGNLNEKAAKLSGIAADLKGQAAEWERHRKRTDSWDSTLARIATRLVDRTEALEKQNSELKKVHEENMALLASKLKEQAAEWEKHRTRTYRWDNTLVRIATRLEVQIEALEKQNSELKERCEEMVKRTAAVEKPYSQLKERYEEMGEQTAALDVETEESVAETKESGKPSAESDCDELRLARTTGFQPHGLLTARDGNTVTPQSKQGNAQREQEEPEFVWSENTAVLGPKAAEGPK